MSFIEGHPHVRGGLHEGYQLVVQFAQVKQATILVTPSSPGGGASYSISNS